MMASRNSNVLYKYESMRTKWSRWFEGSDRWAANWIKNFFKYFYRDHRNFRFVVGELFDGKTYLLVKPTMYEQIKEEIENEIDEILPEVAQIRNATIIRQSKSFPDFQSFKNYSTALKEENFEIERRKRREGKKSLRKLRKTLRTNPAALVLAFDLEVYEHDHDIILEIGFVKTYLDEPEKMQTFHFIIKENLRYKNRDYVPDNRHRFMFGNSKYMSLRRAAAKIQQHIDDADFLVTHSGAHDEEFLENCVRVSVSEKLMFDTQILVMALFPNGPLFYGLKGLLSDLDVEYDEDVLHNGGNDAYYTMEAFLAMTDEL